MGKHTKKDFSSNGAGNPYAIGHSPAKSKSKIPHHKPVLSKHKAHTLCVRPTRGHMVEIIISEHPFKVNTDAFMPNIYHLLHDDECKGKEGIVLSHEQLNDLGISKEPLEELGIRNWYELRGPDGRPVASGDGEKFPRRVITKVNEAEQIKFGRKKKAMLTDLEKLTSFAQKVANATNKYETVYEADIEIRGERNPNDGKLVTIDHYLLDEDVVELMETNLKDPEMEILDIDFVKNYFDVACAYFNPYRKDLPESARQYGFPMGSALIEMTGMASKANAIDEQDMEEFS